MNYFFRKSLGMIETVVFQNVCSDIICAILYYCFFLVIDQNVFEMTEKNLVTSVKMSENMG